MVHSRRLFTYREGNEVPETTSSIPAACAYEMKRKLEADPRVRVLMRDAFGGDCPPYPACDTSS